MVQVAVVEQKFVSCAEGGAEDEDEDGDGDETRPEFNTPIVQNTYRTTAIYISRLSIVEWFTIDKVTILNVRIKLTTED